MPRLLLLIVLPLLICLDGQAQGRKRRAKPAPQPQQYAGRITDLAGRPAGYGALVQACRQAEVVFVGEFHDDSLCHALEADLISDVAGQAPATWALAMEMLERDDQVVVSEYQRGLVSDEQLAAAANLWGNFDTDYKPLLARARGLGLPVLAGNVPRRYASLAFRRGLPVLDSLSAEAAGWMAIPGPGRAVGPVPYAQPSYQAMMGMMGHSADTTAQATAPDTTDPAARRFVDAQALKDATMAQTIATALAQGRHVLHINGSYHSDGGEGILTFLRRLRPGVRTIVISPKKEEERTLFSYYTP